MNWADGWVWVLTILVHNYVYESWGKLLKNNSYWQGLGYPSIVCLVICGTKIMIILGLQQLGKLWVQWHLEVYKY